MRRRGKQGIILRKNWQSMVSKTTAERKCHIYFHCSKPSCFKGLITTMAVEILHHQRKERSQHLFL